VLWQEREPLDIASLWLPSRVVAHRKLARLTYMPGRADRVLMDEDVHAEICLRLYALQEPVAGAAAVALEVAHIVRDEIPHDILVVTAEHSLVALWQPAHHVRLRSRGSLLGFSASRRHAQNVLGLLGKHIHRSIRLHRGWNECWGAGFQLFAWDGLARGRCNSSISSRWLRAPGALFLRITFFQALNHSSAGSSVSTFCHLHHSV